MGRLFLSSGARYVASGPRKFVRIFLLGPAPGAVRRPGDFFRTEKTQLLCALRLEAGQRMAQRDFDVRPRCLF